MFIILLILTIEHAVVIASIGASAFIVFTMSRNITAGTALGVAITGFSPGVIIAVFTSSLVLALAHHFSKKFLKGLTQASRHWKLNIRLHGE